ncbi:MAG: hypothetical protein CMG00_09420 [Candidatus Marinimicrobia bacterium]|nr:hypothetical protein [Candidatus Neomarinimicrobiota bacterium]|tara:strand:+ start:1498 stop:2205 length:708 start_codon:yes stop_codon:yes gene_type:complete
MAKIISLFIYIVMFIPLMIIGVLFIVSGMIFPSRMNSLARLTSISVLKCLFVKVKINGKIPKNRSLIIMYNHSSFIDPFLFAYSSPGKTTGITAIENYKYPVFGGMLKRWNAIPIDRTNIETAKKSIEKGQQAFKDGYNVIILPEGTRTVTGKIKKFKKGGFHMAINSKAPILPVGSKGAFDFKPKNRWYIKPGVVELNIGKIIEPNQYDELGVNGLINEVRSQMKDLTGYKLEE